MTVVSASAPPRNLADLIEQTLEARDLTPAEAARICRVPPNLFSRWRRGTNGISMANLAKLADWIGVPMGDLQVIAGYPPPAASARSLDPIDPTFQIIKAAWAGLDDVRRDIILSIAQSPLRHHWIALVAALCANQPG